MKSGFSIAKLTENSDGKTSASGTMGALICTVGTFCFLVGCLDKVFINKDIDIITQSIVFVSIGAGLLGLRKFKAESPAAKFETGPSEGAEDLG
jgi:hypothetical protein